MLPVTAHPVCSSRSLAASFFRKTPTVTPAVRGVSSTLESLSPPRQLIEVQSVLKLEVLVVAQPKLGTDLGFFQQ